MNGLPPEVLQMLLMQGRPMPQAGPQLPQVNMPAPSPIPQINTPAMQASVGGAMAPIGAPPAGPAGPPPMDIHGFDPSAMEAAQPAPQGGMWQQFASDPSNLMGLLTFGLNMLQPVQPGQSSLGHAAQSIGQGVSTVGTQKELTRKRGLEDKKEAREDKRVGFEEQRVGLEGRRVGEAEKTGKVAREAEQQKIDQNVKLYPKTLEKIQADIDKLISSGKVDEQRGELLRVQAREYPRQVEADLRRANAAVTSAGKPSATESLFKQTADAMVADGKAKTRAEAISILGMDHFGKSSTSSATVQAAEDAERTWRRANPKGADETPEAYDKRAAAARTEHSKTKKQGTYFEERLKYVGEGLTASDRATRGQEFDAEWQKSGGTVPGASANAGRRTSVTAAEVKAEATRLGKSEEEVRAALKAKGIAVK